MTAPYEDIAARLRKVVASTGLTDAEFSRRAGLKPTRVNNWLSGEHRVSLDGALRMREVYSVPLDWLYCGGSVDKLPSSIAKLL